MVHKEILKTIPHAPGVYLFYGSKREVLYVGKAKDLARRVRQYFDSSPKAQKILQLTRVAIRLSYQQVQTEFEALLLEAELIRHYQPKYNSIAKDDKSPIYLLITQSDELPRLMAVRKREMEATHKRPKDRIFGPFASAFLLRKILRSVRSIIPYCTAKTRNGTMCFYTHLGLCDPCPSYIEKLEDPALRQKLVSDYRKNIKRISEIFSGKKTRVIKQLEKDMRAYAANLEYEKAESIKRQIDELERLFTERFDPAIFSFPRDLSTLPRIECIDISNTSGTNATGSLVVASYGQMDTRWYRRFRVRANPTPNDVAMIAEVVKRRFTHPEWPFPDLLVIDGGKGQVHRAQEALNKLSLSIPIIGLAKRFETIVVSQSGSWKELVLPMNSPDLKLLCHMRDEAHRFALSYHRHLRQKAVFGEV